VRAGIKAGLALLALAAALPAIQVATPIPRTAERIDQTMNALVAAYPTQLARHDGQSLFWKSGPTTPIGRVGLVRSADAILSAPEIGDIFAWRYPLEGGAIPLGDPGRARPATFFARVYGDCRTGAVAPRLTNVAWTGGHQVRFTATAGAAAALGRVARELEALGPSYAKYLWPIAGTYNCRVIAGTNSLSMHAMGAAIDLNSAWGRYWRWSARPSARDSIPPAIIQAFEKHGFIWGGKWAHFDSFHFEYRPELILLAKRGG
jgi:hypothetical protein